jgi:hypothetical protein
MKRITSRPTPAIGLLVNQPIIGTTTYAPINNTPITIIATASRMVEIKPPTLNLSFSSFDSHFIFKPFSLSFLLFTRASPAAVRLQLAEIPGKRNNYFVRSCWGGAGPDAGANGANRGPSATRKSLPGDQKIEVRKQPRNAPNAPGAHATEKKRGFRGC